MLRKVDWDARAVAHVIFENVQCDAGNRLDDFTVTQPDGARTREIRFRDFTALHDDAAGEFEDFISSGVGSARANRTVDFGLTEPNFRSRGRVLAQAVSAKVALGYGERELLASFFVEGS